MVTATAAFGLLAFGAQAAWAEGFEGPAYKNPSAPGGTQSAVGNPSGEKPESKLWFHDNRWWAVMWDNVEGDYHIFGLDTAGTDKWLDTGVRVDTRRSSRQDVLSVGNTLYIASHRRPGAVESGTTQSFLFRYTYNPATDKYALNAGFPAVINNARSQTLVIDQDSTGRLWATWTQTAGGGRDVMVASSADGSAWTAPTVLASVTSMDISSVIAFGSEVGVMWNQGVSAFRFRTHPAGAAGAWSAAETAYSSGPDGSDDHINLKEVGGDVYAAVKTTSSGAGSGPLVAILRRDNATDTWSAFGVVNSRWSRPIVLINTTSSTLYVFGNDATSGGGQKSGTIFMKQAPLASLGDLAGAAQTAFIQRGAGGNPGMIDATSTKDNLTNSTGLVVLASDEGTSHYWHNTIAATSEPPPPDPGPNVIRGTAASERLFGTAGRDIIYGGGGNDVIVGRGGNDIIRGQGGNDTIGGGPGQDSLLGGLGRDTLYAKDRVRDVVNGGPGLDRGQRDRGRDRVISIERFF